MAAQPELAPRIERPTPAEVAAALEVLTAYTSRDGDPSLFELRQQHPAPLKVAADGASELTIVPDPTTAVDRHDGHDQLRWGLRSTIDRRNLASGHISRTHVVTVGWTLDVNASTIAGLVQTAAAQHLTPGLFDWYVHAARTWETAKARSDATTGLNSLTATLATLPRADLRAAADTLTDLNQRAVAHRILDDRFTGTVEELLTAVTHATT